MGLPTVALALCLFAAAFYYPAEAMPQPPSADDKGLVTAGESGTGVQRQQPGAASAGAVDAQTQTDGAVQQSDRRRGRGRKGRRNRKGKRREGKRNRCRTPECKRERRLRRKQRRQQRREQRRQRKNGRRGGRGGRGRRRRKDRKQRPQEPQLPQAPAPAPQ